MSLPTARTPTEEEAADTLAAWVAQFTARLSQPSEDSLSALFLDDAYWRDLVACTWSVRTFHGAREVARALAEVPADLVPCSVVLQLGKKPEVINRPGWGTSIEGFITFRTHYARGRGHVKLRRDASGIWRAWTLLTAIDGLIGHEERVGARRPSGFLNVLSDQSTWSEERQAAQDYENHDPAVVVIGGGHSGLAIAARLSVMGVDALVIERNTRIGDNWRSRYDSLYLHNEVWTNHMPYVPYPETWPIFTSKDKLADWLESYVSTLDLNVWTGATLRNADYDEVSSTWRLEVTRKDGRNHVLKPRHLVMAPGVFGEARELELAGSADFAGTIIRSQDYQFDTDSAGKRVLVIGTGSSAHDIAKDYCEHGAQVTMLQRSTTTVVSVDPGARLAYSIYEEGGRPTEDCDLIGASSPLPLVREMHKELYIRVAELDADLIRGLNDAGFRTDYGEDGSGFLMKYYLRGGGYYINVGCSELIIDREIKIKHGVEVQHLESDAAVFSDGTRLPVDVIVVAAGFGNMQEVIRRLLGDDVAERVGPVWGLDDEGELRAMYRPTGQDNLWIMGGSFVQCRLMSKVLAHQIVAREAGLPVSIAFDTERTGATA